MRTVKYSVAMSLDGYIATPDGGYDWIIDDPTIDLAAQFKSVDAMLVGRRTYEVMQAAEGLLRCPGWTSMSSRGRSDRRTIPT